MGAIASPLRMMSVSLEVVWMNACREWDMGGRRSPVSQLGTDGTAAGTTRTRFGSLVTTIVMGKRLIMAETGRVAGMSAPETPKSDTVRSAIGRK